MINNSDKDRQNKLQSLINRLNNGESLESVRKDFVTDFKNVSADEIAEAEQQLIKAGTPIKEVQQLCDVHSAMMHHAIDEEVIEVADGHPVQILQLENEAFNKLIDELNNKIAADDVEFVVNEFKKLNAIHSHYGKKEGLFMPILYEHGVTGPSQVMWAVDDEIKAEIRGITKQLSVDNYNSLKYRITAILTRVREMIFKEEKIFIPLTMRFFTQDEWFALYRDMPEYGYALIGNVPKWSESEQWIASEKSNADLKFDEQTVSDGVIHFPTGDITLTQLQSLLKLLPMDITFIDKDDIVRFFINEGKIFARPKSSLGLSVFTCHPPQLLPMIKQMLTDFKSKKRSRMEVWRQIKGKPVGVKYLAVYDSTGEYIGTVELVQDFSEALIHFADKN